MQIRNLSNTLKIQGSLGLLMVLMFVSLEFSGVMASSGAHGLGWAAIYGLFIGIVNVVLLGITFRKANAKSAEDPKAGILVLYLSAVLRFILLAVLFILGLQLLKLNALAVVLTFVVMQIAQVFNLKGKQRLTD